MRVALLFLLIAAGCAPSPTPRTFTVEPLASPTEAGSRTPRLFADTEGGVHLTWQTPSADSVVLRHARWQDGAWSAPRTLASAGNGEWFVNWADFPAFATLGNEFVAHVLQKSSDASPYAYDVALVRSTDGGQRWTRPTVLHDDGLAAEHGFVSLIPMGDETGVVWLDGRNTVSAEGQATGQDAGGHGGGGPMTIRYATLTADGEIRDRAELDASTCDCCNTAAVATDAGPVVFYRDRTEDEIRDIYVTRRVDGQWTTPTLLHDDGWEIGGCPVNGPATDAQGMDLAVAWFTGAGGETRVKIAFSNDAGATYTAPIVIDEGRPLGRVDVVLLDDGSALVTWLESGEPSAVMGRVVHADGRTEPAFVLTASASARSSGFPQLVRTTDGQLIVAWTDVGETLDVRLGRLVADQLPIAD